MAEEQEYRYKGPKTYIESPVVADLYLALIAGTTVSLPSNFSYILRAVKDGRASGTEAVIENGLFHINGSPLVHIDENGERPLIYP